MSPAPATSTDPHHTHITSGVTDTVYNARFGSVASRSTTWMSRAGTECKAVSASSTPRSVKATSEGFSTATSASPSRTSTVATTAEDPGAGPSATSTPTWRNVRPPMATSWPASSPNVARSACVDPATPTSSTANPMWPTRIGQRPRPCRRNPSIRLTSTAPTPAATNSANAERAPAAAAAITPTSVPEADQAVARPLRATAQAPRPTTAKGASTRA